MSDQSRIPVEDRAEPPAEEERPAGDAHAGRSEPARRSAPSPTAASDEEAPEAREDDVDLFAPLPDDLNPALIDARKAYIITMLGSILFCGAVIVFLLL